MTGRGAGSRPAGTVGRSWLGARLPALRSGTVTLAQLP
jgi:hypothetical protein